MSLKRDLSALEYYFKRFKTKQRLFNDKPVEKIKLIVVIPVYNEPDFFKTLKCLVSQKISFFAEIIVIINDSDLSPETAKAQNQKTFEELKNFRNNNPKIKILFSYLKNLPPQESGVGFARKTGFDEAVRRFLNVKNPYGVIVSLDADTTCDENYLTEIHDFFEKHPDANGANIRFEHPIEGNDFPQEVYKAVTLYELYMRYYVSSLRFSGFPYAFHTIGSAFAVKALTYAKQGGMSTKQAGEDFYFLTKIFPLGNFYEINTTTVYPSPRITDRVPFGTGVAVKQIIENNLKLQTYNFQAFIDLKKFFSQTDKYFKKTADYDALPKSIAEFLQKNNFDKKLENINKNSASLQTFKKRFFHWFDGFRVLKFLNFSHPEFYPKQEIIDAVNMLLEKLGYSPLKNAKEQLILLRNLHRTLS